MGLHLKLKKIMKFPSNGELPSGRRLDDPDQLLLDHAVDEKMLRFIW